MKRYTLFHDVFHILAHCRYRGAPVLKWAEVNDLYQMAKIFDVLEAAVCIRLKRLGLI